MTVSLTQCYSDSAKALLDFTTQGEGEAAKRLMRIGEKDHTVQLLTSQDLHVLQGENKYHFCTTAEVVTASADAPKADAPKADAPKADAPKADAPKADAPKADAQPGMFSRAWTSVSQGVSSAYNTVSTSAQSGFNTVHGKYTDVKTNHPVAYNATMAGVHVAAGAALINFSVKLYSDSEGKLDTLTALAVGTLGIASTGMAACYGSRAYNAYKA